MKQLGKAISYLKRMINGKLQGLSTSNTKKISNISTYQSLREVNVLLYEEVTNTGNVLLLDKDYNENKQYKQHDLDYLKDAFTHIIDLFVTKLDNKKALNGLATDKKKNEIAFKIMMFQEAIKVLTIIKRNYKAVDEPFKKIDSVLSSIKVLSIYVNFKPLNSIDDNIKIIAKLIKSNETTFKRLFPDDEIQKESKIYTIYDQATDIMLYLDIKFRLELEKINLEEWVSYLNKVEKKIQYENSKIKTNGRN